MRRRERDRFSADELAIVLSHYDLGAIESITEFKRGSRRSPKVGIVSAAGKFLLKKRDLSRGGMERARYAHAIQNHLTRKGFLLPRLIRPRGAQDTILELDGELYELFDYVSGHPYNGELAESRDAGRALARFHEAMLDFPIDQGRQSTGYHDATAVQTGLNAIPGQLSSHDSAVGRDAEVLGLTAFLFETYTETSQIVEAANYAEWPTGVVHADWHPGNLIFKRGRVLAVIDYDCVRVGKPICDVANGALHFSLLAGGELEQWPDRLDVERVGQFLAGYEEIRGIGSGRMQALPYLMIEALIAESVLPIAATGSFGPFDGFGFMQMVRRKVKWIQQHIEQLQAVTESAD